MYRICVVGFISFLLLRGSTQAQQVTRQNPVVIEPYRLTISSKRTTNIIFPYAIKSVDRGSSDILVQKAKGVDNILQVKADTANFPETNLSVVTADARFYSFLLSFADVPSKLNLLFEKDSAKSNVLGILTGVMKDEGTYAQVLKASSHQKPFLKKRNRSHQLRLRLEGIYLKDSLLAFVLHLKNGSRFTYIPGAVRFVIKNRKQAQRSVQQELEMLPLYPQLFSAIEGGKEASFTIGFKPFTFRKTQQLTIHVEEKDGGRTVKLPVKLHTLLKARSIGGN